MLLAIRDYLRERGMCTLLEISQHFKVGPEAMQGMLQHWVRKGLLTEEQSGCQQGCVSCAPEQLVVYRWLQTEQGTLIPLCEKAS
ncbi:FeoC-like transcriptional regulator [Endozoicomonas arenosclerae]|uniref:FeoC-like transcriptional regulator n=1 Tax=Endozoicomonas arenosclerae TaxID=1633495 RepID=UPI0009A23AC3